MRGVLLGWHMIHRIDDNRQFILLWTHLNADTASNASAIGFERRVHAADALDFHFFEALIRALLQAGHTARARIEVHLRNADDSLPFFWQGQGRDRAARAYLAAEVAFICAAALEGVQDRGP